MCLCVFICLYNTRRKTNSSVPFLNILCSYFPYFFFSLWMYTEQKKNKTSTLNDVDPFSQSLGPVAYPCILVAIFSSGNFCRSLFELICCGTQVKSPSKVDREPWAGDRDQGNGSTKSSSVTIHPDIQSSIYTSIHSSTHGKTYDIHWQKLSWNRRDCLYFNEFANGKNENLFFSIGDKFNGMFLKSK